MTAKEKVLAKYPGAVAYHQPFLGGTRYVIAIADGARRGIGEALGRESKAWTNAAKNIANGQEPMFFR